MIQDTLKERGSRYGDFSDNARVTEQLLSALESAPSWEKAGPLQRQGAYMICHKLSRAFCGDPSYVDNWHDISGFATLVEERLSTSVPIGINKPPVSLGDESGYTKT